MGYSIGIGLLASSFPWLHHNPLLSAGIAVVFAIVLGILIDHLLRWWHKHLAAQDAEAVDEWLDGGPGQVPLPVRYRSFPAARRPPPAMPRPAESSGWHQPRRRP